MSTATKLTYLNDTKQLLKENINNLGGNLTNEPFRQYASVLEGIYESLPKVSGIGASLSLSPSLMGKIKLNEIQGDTLQNGTPTPSSPVPIQSVTGLQNVEVCDKNLLDISTLQYGYIGSNGNVVNTHTAGEMYSNFIKVSPSTTYTFKIFETSSTYNNWFVVGEYSTNDQSSFIIRDTMTTATQNYITFTTNENTQYVRVSARNLENATKVQLEQGSATTYEPYKGNTYEVNLGNIELNKKGDYKDSIKKSTGKNLIQEVVQGSFNFNNGTNTDNATRVRTNVFKVKPNTTYTVSSKIALGECCTYYYENDGTTGIPGIIVVNDTTTKTVSFTTPSNAYYMKIRFGKEAVPYIATDDNNIMLNEGSTALPYEPYGKVWYVEKQYMTKVLNGSETWTRLGTGTTPYKYYTNKSEFVGLPTTTGALSTHFVYDGVTSSSNVYRVFYFNMSSGQTTANGNITFTTPDITSVNDFKTWLSTHNTEILYQLATPIYEVITNTELINQLESLYNAKSKDGTTNINVTSEDLSMILNVSVIKGE